MPMPIDWEHGNEVLSTAKLQIGKTLNKNIGVYIDSLVGIGSDRPYDWSVGTGIRFKY